MEKTTIIVNGERMVFNSKKVAMLQKRLGSMPLAPQDRALRRRRDRLQKQLLEEAEKSGDVSEVNLQVGYF